MVTALHGFLNSRRLQSAFTALALVFLVAGLFLSRAELPFLAVLPVHLAAYFFGGAVAFVTTAPRLLKLDLDVDFLMLLAAAGAAVIGAWSEGATLLFLFSLSNTLQTYALDRSRRAIGDLMKERPNTASVRRNGAEVEVPVEDLRIRDIVIVRPGEMLAADGVIRAGESELNEASITGEARPVFKETGARVFAGTLNTTGTLDVEVTERAEDSTLARIVKMVESAQSRKARTQQALERFEAGYAWLVVAAAGVAILLPWLMLEQPFDESFYRAMVLLVVASPCALVISTPAAILSAIARGARAGVLFKGGVYLERMADAEAIVFDKTGTLTTGRPGVTDILLAKGAPEGFGENELLAYAAALESRSEHVIAREIILAAEKRNVRLPMMTDFVALPGRGVHATLEGYQVWIGSTRLYEEHGEPMPEDLLAAKHRLEAEGKSVLVVHRELDRYKGVGVHEPTGGWLGIIAMMDTLRPDAAECIRRLRAAGIREVHMLTGDNQQVAEAIAREAGIDSVMGDLLPEDKVAQIRKMEDAGTHTIMVGDGVNDAPALANATVGVAMGGAGSDVALESAHCVLMSDDLTKVPFAVQLSRRAVGILRANILFSLAVIVLLALGVFVVDLPMPIGVIGHEGSTLLVCLNGLRLLWMPDPPHETQP